MKDEKIKESIVKVKTYIVEMPKKKKIIFGSIGGAIILLAIIITVVLNMNSAPAYRVLYSNIDADESSNVYAALLEMGVSPQMNEKGQVMVPSDQYDMLLLQLAAQGYPQTGTTYDLFANHSGMTTTESQNEQWRIYQLQELIQNTLKRLDGVRNASVIITMPKESDYVWQQAESTERPTASILLTLTSGTSLLDEQVTAIKNLVAASVPRMQADDVTVVDAGTNLELFGVDEKSTALNASQNLQFEQQIQDQIEANARRVLEPRYGSDGVVAVAKVTIDYDAMMTERYELLERPEEGGGFLTNDHEEYDVNGRDTVGGIVGEEDNTDIPQQNYQDPSENEDLTHYERDHAYDYGYLKTQIEKGNAKLSRATVSVMVNERTLTETRREELTDLISKATDIPAEEISVSTFTVPEENEPEPEPEQQGWTLWTLPLWVYIAVGSAVLLVLVLLIVAVVIRKKQKRLAQQQEQELEEKRQTMENEINQYKQQLSEAAMAGSDPKNDAIMDEVRNFAKENPEITANLLRSWLKEDEE